MATQRWLNRYTYFQRTLQTAESDDDDDDDCEVTIN